MSKTKQARLFELGTDSSTPKTADISIVKVSFKIWHGYFCVWKKQEDNM